nr:hypothetical protein Iba_chr04fCG7410 [Ipomoea batatas]
MQANRGETVEWSGEHSPSAHRNGLLNFLLRVSRTLYFLQGRLCCWATTASWRCLKPPSGTGEPPNPAFLNSASQALPASAPEPTSLAALAYEPLSKSFTALASASTAEPKPSRQLPRISFLSSPRLGSLRRSMMAFKVAVASSRAPDINII